MVVFHAASSYQTLESIVYSLKIVDKKVFLYTKAIEHQLNVSKLEDFFDVVKAVEIRKGFSDLNNHANIISEYYMKVFGSLNIDLNDVNDFFVGGAHYNFGVFLVLNNFPFYFMEDACGLLSEYKHIMELDAKSRPEVDLIYSYGLYDGTASNIKEIICNVNEQQSGFHRDKMKHFDVVKELYGQSQDCMFSILEVFGYEHLQKIIFKNNSVLVLSQHYANLNMMTYEQQYLLYGILFDYFLDGKDIWVKKHPSDIFAYDMVYPFVNEIKEKFLSEFVPLLIEPMPNEIATISSTGINSLRSLVPDIVEFDFEFEKQYEYVHKMYVTLNYLSKKNMPIKLKSVGINIKLIENLCKYSGIHKKLFSAEEALETLLVGEVSEEEFVNFFNKNKENFNIFFISGKLLSFCKELYPDLYEKLSVIEIEKQNLNINRDIEIYNDFMSEYVYFIDGETNMVYKDERELKNLEMKVKAESLSEENKEIAVLKGILESTENRLNYYIKKCRQLEEKLGENKRL